MFYKLIGTTDPNDDTQLGNNVPRDPPPTDPILPQNHPPNNPLPPQNPHWLEDLIIKNLFKLRVLQTTYNTIPALAPMLSMLNTIVDNIEILTNEQNATLHWHDQIHAMFDEVVALNITKDDIVSLFVDPKNR